MKRYLIILFLSLVLLTSCLSVEESNRTFTPDIKKPSLTVMPNSSTPQPSLTPEPVTSELISLNQEWNSYLNYRLGFSMDIPTSMYRYDALCQWDETLGDYVMPPEAGVVPVVVIEGEDTVYITSQHFIQDIKKTPVSGGAEYKGCEYIESNLEFLRDWDYTSYLWEIKFRTIESPEDLEILIDEYFGECFSAGEIKPVEGKSYSWIRILGDEKPVEESTCLLRGGYKLYYSEELQNAAIWYTGQSIHFPTSGGVDYGSQDGDMLDSFEFIPKIPAP